MKSLLKMQAGGLTIPSLENRPFLTQWVSEYWAGFQVLGGSRIVHQGGIGPIPLTEIVAYIDVIYLSDVDERLKFIRMIQSLDSVYVKHVNTKASKRLADKKAAARNKPRVGG